MNTGFVIDPISSVISLYHLVAWAFGWRTFVDFTCELLQTFLYLLSSQQVIIYVMSITWMGKMRENAVMGR